MKVFSTMAISATGLTAERLRMDIIAENIANINTTRTPQGGPYQRKMPIFAEELERVITEKGMQQRGRGVQVTKIVEDTSLGQLVYDPQHPDADQNGYVRMPNVNIANEMVNLISASRSYEANVTALNAAKQMALKALEIGK